jgi:hypothetical protein
MQAILRWDCNNGTMAKAPWLPLKLKYKLLVLFCKAQHCCSFKDWPTYEAEFLQAAKKAIIKQGADTESHPAGNSTASSG